MSSDHQPPWLGTQFFTEIGSIFHGSYGIGDEILPLVIIYIIYIYILSGLLIKSAMNFQDPGTLTYLANG